MAKAAAALTVKRPSAASTVVRSFATAVTQLVVDPSTVAANPHNPEVRVEEGESLDELIASVGEVGVIQPVTLASRDAWVKAHGPDGIDEAADWVLLAGHRRRAAAIATGRSDLPAIVRDDLAAEDAAVLLAENGRRLDLDPFHEADAYQRMITQGRTQAQIAQHLGVSQSHVAKRLAITKIPEPVRAPFRAGEWRWSDAYELARTSNDAVLATMATHPIDTGWSAPRWAAEVADGIAEEANRARLAANPEGGTLVDAQPSYTRRLWGKSEIAAARKAGTLLVYPSRREGETLYYTSAPASSRSNVSDADKARAKRRKAATGRRRQALIAAATAAPSAAQLRLALIDMTIDGHADQSVRKIATQIAADIGIPQAQNTPSWEFLPWAENGGMARERLAWLLYLAWSESRLRAPILTGGDLGRRYLELLTATGGYQQVDEDETLLAGTEQDEARTDHIETVLAGGDPQ